MPIYRVKFPGLDNVIFVRADSAAKARDQVVTCTPLTSAEMVDALDSGLKLYKVGESIVPDQPDEAPKAEDAVTLPRIVGEEPEQVSVTQRRGRAAAE